MKYSSEWVTRTISLAAFRRSCQYSSLLEGSRSNASFEAKLLYLSSARMLFYRIAYVLMFCGILSMVIVTSLGHSIGPVIFFYYAPGAIAFGIASQLYRVEEQYRKTRMGVFTTKNLTIGTCIGIVACIFIASFTLVGST